MPLDFSKYYKSEENSDAKIKPSGVPELVANIITSNFPLLVESTQAKFSSEQPDSAYASGTFNKETKEIKLARRKYVQQRTTSEMVLDEVNTALHEIIHARRVNIPNQSAMAGRPSAKEFDAFLFDLPETKLPSQKKSFWGEGSAEEFLAEALTNKLVSTKDFGPTNLESRAEIDKLKIKHPWLDKYINTQAAMNSNMVSGDVNWFFGPSGHSDADIPYTTLITDYVKKLFK